MKLLLPSLLFLCSFTQTQDRIVFKTRSGDKIIVSNDIIHYSGNPVSKTIEAIVYNSKYNRLIEQNSRILLFLEIDGRPNYNTIKAFDLKKLKATELAEVVYNDKTQGIGSAPFTDMDGDGKMEFGGFDLTEWYDSKDSIYYNPSQYYEISDGKVKFDSSLTRKMDIKVNGVYLSKPLDKDRNCCVVIKKPKTKSIR
ncbi:hypothetical protein A4H97_31160 [Niastella yeongjuensis]|uniref:Uncharacterized protein n=1 Tax=Niastella yeongjuensis TaxID=354355 RepID=A0A1V9EJC0_9BACT|nr:hypothetical protein [Niastella yeongjuensis]OQP46223.1 hypothetical protein A4H97_31160 [Niastella yeongjuensis]SEP45963.1 hypothetical protein SAMN05660816_06387 [Niastella yeongjuensis]